MASWSKDGSGNWKKSESTKKNYTIVNGKKVEQAPASNTPSATKSDTWDKDKVTLEEARQQTSDVEKGVIDVDKGNTSIQAPTATETISLNQAKQQTETESANRVTAAEFAQASQAPTEVSKQTTTVTNVDSRGNYTVKEETVTASKYNNLAPIKAGSNVKSAAQLEPVVKTETESKVVEQGFLKDRFSTQYGIADPINYFELKVSKPAPSTGKVQLSEAAMNTFSKQEISAPELASSSTTTKPFALEEKFNNPQAINTENIINASANAYDTVTGIIGEKVVAPAAKVADKAIEYAGRNLESADQRDYSKYEATPLYGDSEPVLKEAPTQTIANAASNAASKTAGYYTEAVYEVKEAARNTLDAGNVFAVMDEGSGPNYQINEKKTSETAAARFVLSAGETIAMAPVAVPQAAIELVKNPVSATKDFVVNTGESIVADPATGLGAVAGMLLTGSAIKGAAKVGKGATGKVGEFATDVKNSRIYEKQTAALYEFKTVPEAVKNMPDVANPTIKMEIPEMGVIRSAESFKLKNPKTADVVASKAMVEQKVIAKVESPESAVNYAENLAKLNEFKTVPEAVKSMPDVGSEPRNTVLRPPTTEIRNIKEALDYGKQVKKELNTPSVRKLTSAEFERMYGPEIPVIDKPKVPTSDIVSRKQAFEYGDQLRLQRLLSDESGSSHILDIDASVIKKSRKTKVLERPKDAFADSFEKMYNNPVEDIGKRTVYRTKRSEIERLTGKMVERPVKRTKRSELISSIEEQMASKTKIPSLEEQFRAKSVQSAVPRSKAFVVPSFALNQTNLAAQMNEQVPTQANIQQPVRMQQPDYVQSIKQITRSNFMYKTQNMPSEVQKNKAKSKSQSDTKYITGPSVGPTDIVKPPRRSKSTEPPIVPSFVPTGKKRSSKKGKKSKSDWEYGRLYNNYGDASKWRGI